MDTQEQIEKQLIAALRKLVNACTPMRMPTDHAFHGVRMPEKEIVDNARALLDKAQKQ